MFFNGVNRLLLRRRRTSPSSSVISVTEPLSVTAADSGKTYSLDGGVAVLILPLREDFPPIWEITVQCSEAGFHVVVNSEDIGQGTMFYEETPYDGVTLASTDAVVTISFDGAYYQAVLVSGTVKGYMD